jgi:hypothetical protein
MDDISLRDLASVFRSSIPSTIHSVEIDTRILLVLLHPIVSFSLSACRFHMMIVELIAHALIGMMATVPFYGQYKPSTNEEGR